MGFASLTGRLRLRTKLLLVVLVPLAGMAAFAGMWAAQRLDTARAAEADRDRVDLGVELADLMSDVRLDGTFSVGIHGTESLKAQGVGFALPLIRHQVVQTRARIADRVARLEADGVARLPSWAAARREIAGLAAVRRDLAAAPNTVPATKTAFARFDEAADAIEQVVFDVARPGAGQPSGPVALAGLSAVEGQAQREMIAVNQVATAPFTPVGPGPSRVQAARLAEAQASGLRLVLPLLPPRTAEALRKRAASPDEASWADLRARVAAGEIPTLFETLPISLRRAERLTEIRGGLGAELTRMAASTARSARAGFDLALALSISLSVVTLLLALAVVRSASRTLRSLEESARRIGEGDLEVEPLAVQGQDETAVLARSFNQMTATLRTLGAQMSALAEGRGDDPVLRQELPGALGDALHGSVRRVGDTTAALRASEEMSRLIVDTAAEAIWTVDPRGVVVGANRASEDLAGRRASEMIGRPLAEVLRMGGQDGPAPDGTLVNRDAVALRRDGTEVPVLVSSGSVRHREHEDTLTTVFARDISEHKELERRLAHEATHDALTGLPNRQALTGLVDAAVLRAAGRRAGFAVLFIDLDRFKHVNDAFGHRSGDELLRGVAERLCRGVRDEDTVARLGGDEFVVIAESVEGVEEAQALARRLVAAVEEPYDLGGTAAHISASVGVLWHAGGPADSAEVIRLSDIAMFRAKETGPGNVAVFDDAMRRDVAERETLEIALRDAIASGGLTAVYQPIVDMESGRPVSLELLARWPAPEGDVPPSVFITVAEESGLVVDIGRWALREACRRVGVWRDAHPGLDLRVAVNISGLHVTRGDIVADVVAALAETGADPRHLRIELTETHLLDGNDAIDAALAELGRLGVGLSIDDFGTGYSSLTYLRRLPVDEVKIDRSFVSGLDRRAQDRTIIELVGTLGATLGIATVAEGVETPEQADALRAMGLRLGQGYAFSPPLAAGDVEGWLTRALTAEPSAALHA